jgi:hypothetical protein
VAEAGGEAGGRYKVQAWQGRSVKRVRHWDTRTQAGFASGSEPVGPAWMHPVKAGSFRPARHLNMNWTWGGERQRREIRVKVGTVWRCRLQRCVLQNGKCRDGSRP